MSVTEIVPLIIRQNKMNAVWKTFVSDPKNRTWLDCIVLLSNFQVYALNDPPTHAWMVAAVCLVLGGDLNIQARPNLS